MQERSNLKMISNLFRVNPGVMGIDDRNYMAAITDPDAIRYMKENHVTLTEQQQKIYDNYAIHCPKAPSGDYPWGLVLSANIHTGEIEQKLYCACTHTTCGQYAECIRKQPVRVDEVKQDICMNDGADAWDYTFAQYQELSRKKKVTALLTYWKLTEGPYCMLQDDGNGQTRLLTMNEKYLRNPFTGEVITLDKKPAGKHRFISFTINENSSTEADLLTVYSCSTREICMSDAEDILKGYGVKKSDITGISSFAVGSSQKRITASEIKRKHINVKKENQCRHAGCNAKAEIDGYCYEHYWYNKSQSK